MHLGSTLGLLLSVGAATLCQQEASCLTTAFASTAAYGARRAQAHASPGVRTHLSLWSLTAPVATQHGRIGSGVRSLRWLRGRSSGVRGKAGLQMVFLPDDAGFDQKSGEGSSSGSYSSGDESGVNANQVVRQYSPITGYDLESPEELNERLRPTGLERHRLQIAPDEAFGAIFRMEGSLVDTMPIHVSAWTRVAEEMNLTKPELADVSLAMTMPPEKAIQRVMYWTQDWGDTKRIAFRRAELYYQLWQVCVRAGGDGCMWVCGCRYR